MFNQVILVGRIVEDINVKEIEDGKQVAYITVGVPRSYKNEDGVYETDFIDCVLWNAIATNTAEYCHKGDLVGIKGRVQTEVNEDKKITRIIVEKITFLSSATK